MDEEVWHSGYEPERVAKAAAETVTTTAFWFYHPDERKARAREALRRIVEVSFRKDKDDGIVDCNLEALWNIMAGHNDPA